MFYDPNNRSRQLAVPLFLACILTVAAPTGARELSTDRPDQTESPYSVEAGRYQAEFQLAAVGRGPGDGDDAWQLVGLNLKRGLSRSVDIQLVTTGHESTPSSVGRERGTGDLTMRLKWNVRGNDAEGFAYGFMPFVCFPTGSEHLSAGGFEGGLIVPVAFSLTNRVGMGLMAQGDVVRDADGSGVHFEPFFTATASRDILGALGGFVEIAARFLPGAEGEPEVMFDVGTTYGVGPDTQWDAGVQIGLSEGAEDFRAFVGLSIRR